MTKTLFAAVAVAAIALAGCAKEDKMMKDADTAPAAESTATEPVTYTAPPQQEEVMVKEEASGGDAMMDLCASKGGSIGEWPGEGGATKTCRAADGNEYPLASLSSYEAFQ